MKHLQQKLNISLLPGETILTVQRKHWISLVLFLLVHLMIIACVFIAAIIILAQQYTLIVPKLIIDTVLLLLSFLAVIGMFSVMDWYYQFYVITNKRIIHVHFFRITGQHFEEVFISRNSEVEIRRITDNILFDLLNIDDIHIIFRRQERLEPYILERPENPQEIERILDELAIGKK